jgi:nitrite reductase/ring-hydroxylating ferredoxin subunit/DMSO/TMAO reductase YedYZ heme-binding membrane subunit
LAAFVVLACTTFAVVSWLVSPNFSAETIIIRTCAVVALSLLHIILCLGPLARLAPRFLPLLYNRRHLGVTMFFLGLIHASLALFQFHGLGDANPLVSLFTAYSRDFRAWGPGAAGWGQIPFEPFGAAALAILFVMAATSHDFWLRNLGASFWKSMHLGVYVAYGLLLVHVAYGVFQSEPSIAYPVLLGVGFAVVSTVHWLAAAKEKALDQQRHRAEREGLVDVCAPAEVSEGRGKVVLVAGQRIALFRHQGRLFATSNVCRHQGGPVGEGRIIDGCITCPWHGWNYQPEDGCSPPPFKEILSTYETRVVAGRVWVSPKPNSLGTRCEGAVVV